MQATRETATRPLLTLALHVEQDVVLVRQRARLLAALLGFDSQDQVRIATAVSEIARNAFRYAGGGKVEFALDQDARPAFVVIVRDDGPGIDDLELVLGGHYVSSTGMGIGLAGARRLMDRFDVQSAPGEGTQVSLSKFIPGRHAPFSQADICGLIDELARRAPHDPIREIQQQNNELLIALEELGARQEDLARLNRELEDTNRGVVALYAELDEKADHLKQISEVKSRFLSDMSHELRTPLNSIMSLASILLDRVDGELSAEQERQVLYIRKAAETLSDLVNDLLDLAKVEAGKVTVKPVDFVVDDLFGALRGMLRPLLTPGSSVSLVFEQPREGLTLHTDEGKVSQILRNFISNALKFTERGEVRVSAVEGPSDTVIFSVADTGIGIAPEDRTAIFNEYAQVESAQQRRTRGTGLGLPLSRKLALMLGGNILLESEVGQGSTFHAFIPRDYAGPTEIIAVPDATTKVDLTRLPVLVVEDNRETIFIYEKYLKGTRYQVIPAHNTIEARYLLKQVRPVAIVLDILLDGENAWDLLAEVKADPVTSMLPTMVLTVVDNERRALAMGADAFCIKPVESAWLLEQLDALTARTSRPTVLIVDDEDVSRYIVRAALESVPCLIREAADGASALALVHEDPPDAIILDLVMPGTSGYEVLDALKKDPSTRAVPVIVHTSRTLTPSELEALEREGTVVISKNPSSHRESGAGLREALACLGISQAMREEDRNA